MNLHRDVFLKIYDADRTITDVFREPQLLVEATKNSATTGNLIEVYDAEILGDNQYVLVAMEYLRGGSLLGQLEYGPLPLMDAIRVTMGILHGVAQLHSAGLVHRDIKPANVILALQGNARVPKLGDFGSVARISTDEGTVSASRHSALYVPPEGWAEPGQYGKRSDLYQVGMVLHELVNGPLAYDQESHLDRAAREEIKALGVSSLSDLDPFDKCKIVERAIARRASNQKLLDIGPQQPYQPRALSRVINKATAPSPQSRYGAAWEFMAGLKALSFPNWNPLPQQEAYEAHDWQDYDWRIIGCKKKKNGTAFEIRRARAGTQRFRRWKTCESVHEAAREVANVG